MRIGLMAPGPPVPSMIKRAQRAERAGYDGLWVGCHFMGWVPDPLWEAHAGPSAPSSNDMLEPGCHLAALAMATTRMRLGTVVMDSLTRHPAVLAHTFLTLHQLSEGRAVLGLGAGEAANTIPYGIPATLQASRLEEAVEVIRALWGGGEVSRRGRFFSLDRAVMGFAGGPTPPIWLGVHGPRLLDFAGRAADGWLPGPMPAEDYRDGLALVRKAAHVAGRSNNAVTAAMFGYAVLHEREADMESILASPVLRCFALALPAGMFERYGCPHPLGIEGTVDFIPNRVPLKLLYPALERVPQALMRDLVFHGCPSQAIEQMRRYEQAGCEMMVLVNLAPMVDPRMAKRSYELLDEVVRHFARVPGHG